MKGSAKWYDSGCSSWLLSHKRNMQSPVHVKWRLKVISPDLFALNSKATAPKNPETRDSRETRIDGCEQCPDRSSNSDQPEQVSKLTPAQCVPEQWV